MNRLNILRIKSAEVCVIVLICLMAAEAVASSNKDQRLEKTTIRLGHEKITVEVADSPEERERGLMFRKSLPADEGMLFIFEDERPLAFWMKNTLIPLQIGYFDSRRVLVDLVEMTPAVMGEQEPRSYPSRKPARYALEMNAGWFTRKGIKPGVRFSFVDSKIEARVDPNTAPQK